MASWATATTDEQPQLLPKKIEAFALASASSLPRREATTASLSPLTAPSSPGAGDHGCLGHGEDLSNLLLPKKVDATWPPGQ